MWRRVFSSQTKGFFRLGTCFINLSLSFPL